VACGLIDAHAGALGMLATRPVNELAIKSESQLCLIAGTSSCHMILNKTKMNIPGIWGPYFSAILGDLWLHEGGQSSVGSLIDHLIQSHPSFPTIMKTNDNIYEHLEAICITEQKSRSLESIHMLTKDLHVFPDFHGNRSPIADSSMKGSICGLSLDKDQTGLAMLYLATIQALSYGTRNILDQLQNYGHNIKVVTICGGLSKSNLFIQTNADVLGLNILKPDEAESVLLGSAMTAAAAASTTPLESILETMSGGAQVYLPAQSTMIKTYHDKKYKVFKAMLEDQLKYRTFME
jgi:FGGY-family pentulose kinase